MNRTRNRIWLRHLLLLAAGCGVFIAPGILHAETPIPLQRIILEGKVVTADDQTPLNRVWVAVYAGGEEPLAWEWTRADGSFHFGNVTFITGIYQVRLQSENQLIKDASAEISLPELAPGESPETLLTAHRFLSAQGILRQEISQVLVDRVAQVTEQDKETVVRVMTALIDAVNGFYITHPVTFTMEKVEDLTLQTVDLRGSVRGLLGNSRLRGGVVRFLYKDYVIAKPQTGADNKFDYEDVQVPLGTIKVVASDRFGLFQQVEKEYEITPETAVLVVEDLTCSLRLWVKVAGALIAGTIIWLIVRGRRSPPESRPPQAGSPTGSSDSPSEPLLLKIERGIDFLRPQVRRFRGIAARCWGRTAGEAIETLTVSPWFWMHGGICVVLVLWAGLQLYGHTIQAGGPLPAAEAGAVGHAQQIRDASAENDREMYENALQVPPHFTPFQVLIWSRILTAVRFNQTAWQCIHLAFFCGAVLLTGLAAWALSQRAFRIPAGGTTAGLCASVLLLLSPGAVRYSCSLYPETVSLFLVSAAFAAWCFGGMTAWRRTLTLCSFLLGCAFLCHPMHGLLITVVLGIATLFRQRFSRGSLADLLFFLMPGVVTVALVSRIFLPETSEITYAFLGRGENLGWFAGLIWSFERLLMDYSPYREAMLAILLLSGAMVWISPSRRVKGLAAGIAAGFLMIACISGKYWSSPLALLPILMLFPALAAEAVVSMTENRQRQSYAITIATLVLLAAPFTQARTYQHPYSYAGKEWNVVLENLLPTINPESGALIVGENRFLNSEIVNVALVERYKANLRKIYRPDFQGTIEANGARIADASQTLQEIERWLRNDLVGSVSAIELLQGHPLLKDNSFIEQEGWSQTWVDLLKSQPWRPETHTTVLDAEKVAIHSYKKSIEKTNIGYSRRLDTPYAGITGLSLLNDQGIYTDEVPAGFPIIAQARICNLLDSELRASVWWVISKRFADLPYEKVVMETRQNITVAPLASGVFNMTLPMPSKVGRYWAVAYLQDELGNHLDAAYLADDVRVEETR